MAGKHSRTKGHNYERETATFYRTLGFEARRGTQSGTGCEEPDIVVKDLDFWIECGRRKPGCWIYDKWNQAKRDAKIASGGIPIVHARCDSGDELVIISRYHWGKIVMAMKYAEQRQSAVVALSKSEVQPLRSAQQGDQLC